MRHGPDLMPGLITGSFFTHSMPWLEFALATPVVLWGGWPFFQRGWRSVITGNLNMFTLIALGIGATVNSTGSQLMLAEKVGGETLLAQIVSMVTEV